MEKNISDLQMKIFCQIKFMTEQKNKALTEEVEKNSSLCQVKEPQVCVCELSAAHRL